MKIYLVILTYDITYDCPENGKSWAGVGVFNLKVFDSEKKAQDFIIEYNEVFEQAENENKKHVFPVLPNNKRLRDELGLDLSSFNDNEYFSLNYRVMTVE